MDEYEFCNEYVYSENYGSYFVRYNNDLQGAYERTAPSCVTIINEHYLVAYSDFRINEYRAYQTGYNDIPKCFGLMDMSAVNDVGADVVRRLPGLSLTGKNVVIGFVDTGIDYINPIFQREDGTTRILSIWDQTQEAFEFGNPVFGFGSEFTKEDIDKAIKSETPYRIVPTKDEEGHGTFLASVAAGNLDIRQQFIGIAPDSEIVMVKLKQAKQNLKDYFCISSDQPCYAEDDIALGIEYLVNVAKREGKTLVICIGLGSSQGAHQGTTNIELFLDSIASLRGVCVVTAGGNELGNRSHYAGKVAKGTSFLNGTTINLNNLVGMNLGNDILQKDNIEISVGAKDKGFTMELWGKAPGLLKCSIVSPTGERFDQIQTVRNGGIVANFLYEGTKVSVENIVVEKETGDQVVLFHFKNPSEGIWTISVEPYFENGINYFDAWLPIRDFLNEDTGFVRSNPNVILTTPSNAKGLITLAGYNHVNNALYVNSGRGYTRNGRISPTLTAPAVNVEGVFATNSKAQENQVLYTKKSGTSVAAAICAGSAALLMEWGYEKGNMTNISTESIKQILIRGAETVPDVTYPNEAFGWGILNVYNAFENMRNT